MAHFTTWTALLAHWTDMARMARAIDGTADGPMLQSLPHVITCQALAHALGEVPDLPEGERAAAIDLAAAALARVDEASESMRSAPPHVLIESRSEAQLALDDISLRLCWTMIWEGEEPLRVPDPPRGVPARGDEGTLLLALPGTVLLPGTPVGWWSGRAEPMLGHFVPGLLARPLLEGVQVWRLLDEAGRWVKDRVMPADAAEPPGGTPLLVPRVLGGMRLEMPDPVDGWVGSPQGSTDGAILSWPKR